MCLQGRHFQDERNHNIELPLEENLEGIENSHELIRRGLEHWDWVFDCQRV